MPETIEEPSAPISTTTAAPTYIFNGPVTMIGCNNTTSGDLTIQIEDPSDSIEAPGPGGRWLKFRPFLNRLGPLVGPFLMEFVLRPFLRSQGFDY